MGFPEAALASRQGIAAAPRFRDKDEVDLKGLGSEAWGDRPGQSPHMPRKQALCHHQDLLLS